MKRSFCNYFENKDWYPDYYRTTDDMEFSIVHFVRDYLFQHRIRFILCFRRANRTENKLVKLFCDSRLYLMSRKYGLEIKSNTKIGKGFVLLHPYNITISPAAVVGNNVTMLKGSTIGMGKRINGRGAPTIGNNVYIGINSTIIGG